MFNQCIHVKAVIPVICVWILLCLSQTSAQFFSTRQCSANSTLTASRCSGANFTQSRSACATYCASSSQSSTALYSKFCSGASCGTTSYCYLGPCVPTLTNTGQSSVDVPCSASPNVISGASLGISNTCSGKTPYVINQQVISSTTGDFSLGLIDVSQTGVFTRSVNAPIRDIQQTIAFTISDPGDRTYSNTVVISFYFHTCVIGISGPNGPVTVCQAANVPTLYPELIFQATGIPAGTQVIWDVPSDQGGLGASTAQTTTAPLTPPAVNSPAVITGSTTPVNGNTGVGNKVEISNYNFVTPYSNTYAYSTTGIYGASSDLTTLAVQGECQTLRFSVSPAFAGSGLITNSKLVQVCYSQNC